MKHVIVGYGRFGRIALERLTKQFRRPSVIIVEREPLQAPTVLPPGAEYIQSDAVSFLSTSVDLQPEDVIIPMVPFHLAAAYVLAQLPGTRETALPAGLTQIVPNPFVLDSSNLCASRADFICPDDCPEGDLCTVTGKPRKPLHTELEHLTVPGFTVLVQRSYQILPGVGGYPLSELRGLVRRITAGRYVIATSCKCHAILTAIEHETSS